ncbi:MAG: hypothetical protein WC756_10410 [Taibaiella sp.]|jgi:hypothetical protein
MGNLFRGNTEKKLYAWIDPTNWFIAHNIGMYGHLSCTPPAENNTAEENLLFIPNPKYKGGVTPYHNNVAKKIRTEYTFEFYRPPLYPSRTQAFYALYSLEHAEQYKRFHEAHVKDRILISGIPVGECHYSIHDSGWFDFLCKDANFDDHTITQSAESYWKGLSVSQCELKLYGHPWSQPETWEILFYGTLKISESSKNEVKELFNKAYLQNPLAYPFMHTKP